MVSSLQITRTGTKTENIGIDSIDLTIGNDDVVGVQNSTVNETDIFPLNALQKTDTGNIAYIVSQSFNAELNFNLTINNFDVSTADETAATFEYIVDYGYEVASTVTGEIIHSSLQSGSVAWYEAQYQKESDINQSTFTFSDTFSFSVSEKIKEYRDKPYELRFGVLDHRLTYSFAQEYDGSQPTSASASHDGGDIELTLDETSEIVGREL